VGRHRRPGLPRRRGRHHVRAPRQQRVSTEQHKAVVRRLVVDVFNGGQLQLIDELYDPSLAERARAWIGPFRNSFTDLEMEIVDLVAEGETVAARFVCSGTHTGDWLGHSPTGRRFRRVPEVYFFEFTNGRISKAWGLEDTYRRLSQLGLV
jgi:predicted ester cyclase